MRVSRFILCSTFVVFLAGNARAEFAPYAGVERQTSFALSEVVGGDSTGIAFALLDGHNDSVADDVLELPGAPSSAMLFLSAMVSLGGWHLVRSAKDLRFDALPQWYHAGGPAQVGHATPLDLDFTILPIAAVQQPSGEQKPRFFTWRELRTPYRDQFFLSVAECRGPPTCAI